MFHHTKNDLIDPMDFHGRILQIHNALILNADSKNSMGKNNVRDHLNKWSYTGE